MIAMGRSLELCRMGY
jgi:hypothetical protein